MKPIKAIEKFLDAEDKFDYFDLQEYYKSHSQPNVRKEE